MSALDRKFEAQQRNKELGEAKNVLDAEVAAAGAADIDELLEESTITAEEEAAKISTHNKTRMRDQCYLAYHMFELSEIHRQTQTPASELDILDNADIQKFPRYTYQKTSLLDGRPAEIMPKLHMRENAHKILDATTAQLANLVPMIKLYKVKSTPTTSYEIPFKFYNRTITEADAKKDWAEDPTTEFKGGIGGFQGRAAVGIKSFDWQYISGNFDTIQKDITSKLVLYFQSMDELIRIRQTQVYDPEKDEMVTMTYSYLDLIINPARSASETTLSKDSATPGSDTPCFFGDQFDSSDYEIKASVGWAQWDSATKELSSDFVESVNHSKTNLFLSLTDHAFSIAQDGTFELTITYRSRMEGLLESPKSNVLFCDKNIVNESASFKALLAYEEGLEKLNAEECKDNKKEKEEQKKSLVRIQDGLRNETYKNIIMNLMYPEKFLGAGYSEQNQQRAAESNEVLVDPFQGGTSEFPTSNPDDDLYPPTSSTDDVVEFPTSDSDAGPSAPGSNQRLIYSILTHPDEHLELSATGKIETEAYKPIGHDRISTDDLVFKPNILSELSTGDEEQVEYNPMNPEERMINYFYLGDLLDMLMITVFDNEKYDSLSPEVRKKYAFNNNEIENLYLALGPMQIRDPISNKIKNINMADIPVSVNAFTDWFHRNVIKKRRVVYEFQTFMKDMVSELIQIALGKECFDDIEQHNSSVRTHFISGPQSAASLDPIKNRAFEQIESGESDSGATPRVNMNDVTIEDPIFRDYDKNKRTDEHAHYIVMYSQGPGGLRYPGTPGNDLVDGMTPKQQDLQKGIYHLFIGRDRGLVTSVNFSKTNQPYLRQARLENMGAFNPIAQLSDVYEATIDMMGNTMFLPGSRLYLNPFGLAWGENFGLPHHRGSISNIMGLGGYHIVTSVNNYIESGVFKTTLQVRFETAGDGCVATNTNDSDTNPCPDETD
tara:strand:+ start:1244 stop:4087 length:2844 start_codon:yes stop_codon:yes gene_type:complete